MRAVKSHSGNAINLLEIENEVEESIKKEYDHIDEHVSRCMERGSPKAFPLDRTQVSPLICMC